MTLVADASALYAYLVEHGPAGVWSRDVLRDEELAAPALALYEVANTLRRHETRRSISRATAEQAHGHLLALAIRTMPYSPLARRAWELRHNFTLFDASYIALAELLDATLVTLDERMARGPGIRCRVLTYGTRA